ncbi:MAG: ABC transporter substrate-binding protein, partial [Deltaproteobacteria bacterium]|nr:ABC transporter substrate-binding protein [Deltaproteobacteria bacterium]
MKKMQMITFVFTLVCGLILGGVATQVSATNEPIVIGFIHTLSGPVAMYGKSGEIGGQIAVEEINAAGGVLGRPLKMVSRDDKLSPEVGLREAKSLVLDQKADFLTGTISSAVTQAISEYC